MTLIVHCLAQRPRSLGWIVRVDGQPDVLLPSEYLAVEYGRTVSMSLANRYRVPASLRVWPRLGPFVSEEIRPSMEQGIAVNRVRRQGRG